MLLRRGAGASLIIDNDSSTTILHVLCGKYDCLEFPETFFKIDDRTQRRRVQIDVRDGSGKTPLHLVLLHGRRGTAEVLLRNGADPNLSDAEGSTALHFLCKNNSCNFDEFAELFFKICDDNRQFVLIDARDKLGRTPLHWAVATAKPLSVNALLDRGAEMSRFVFPTEDYYGAGFNVNIVHFFGTELRIARRALLTIEILENAAYELDSSDHNPHARKFNFRAM
ncbi:hypothetical protein TKK_0017972 [Trichogramma kaykai]